MYAFKIIDSYDLKLEFINKIKKSCVVFCIFYEIIFLGKKFTDIVRDKEYQLCYTNKQLIPIYFSLCENYLVEISYILGFSSIYYDNIEG